MEKRGRTSRAEWQKRIERWNDSGLSAEQFAAETGIHVGTLRHWKYFLGKQDRVAPAARRPPTAEAFDFVEVRAAAPAPAPVPMFELELGAERRLRIPAQFEASALERLLAVLERR